MCNVFTVVFLGHRYVDDPTETEERIEELIRTLLREKKYVTFLVGHNGEFDQCVASSVCRVCKNGDHANGALVLPYLLAEHQDNEKYDHEYYTSVGISSTMSGMHLKPVIQVRNRELVDRADLIICYMEKKEGSAWDAVEYALRQDKMIINVAKDM